MAIAARPFRPWEELAVVAAAVWVYLGVNGAGMVGPLVSGALSDRFGPDGARWPFLLALGVGSALALVDALIQWLAPDDAPTLGVDWRYTGVGFALALGVALASLSSALAFDGWMGALYSVGTPPAWFDWANPAAVFAAGVPVVIGAAVLAMLGRRAPVLLVGGIAAVLTGLALGAGVVGATVASGSAMFGTVNLATGALEVLCWPFLYAATVRGVHWRASVAVAAIPTAAVSLVWFLPEVLPPLLQAAMCGVCLLLVGGALAGAAIPLERWLSSSDAGAQAS